METKDSEQLFTIGFEEMYLLSNNRGRVVLELIWVRYFLSKVFRENYCERSTAMADRFWKYVPAEFTKTTLDELYKRD